jgi:hypothetical protein
MYVPPPGVRDQTSNPYKATSKMTSLYYILIFRFSEGKTNGSVLNGIKHSPQYSTLISSLIFRLFPNILTLSHFRRIYLLPCICHGLSRILVSRHERALTIVSTAFTSGPTYLLVSLAFWCRDMNVHSVSTAFTSGPTYLLVSDRAYAYFY